MSNTQIQGTSKYPSAIYSVYNIDYVLGVVGVSLAYHAPTARRISRL